MYCPFCRGNKLRKAGFVYDSKGKHQRYECKSCRRFTYKPKRERKCRV